MQGKFEMSTIRELNFFLITSNQAKEKQNIYFPNQVSQGAAKEIGMDQANGVDTPMSSTTLLDTDVKGADYNITKY